MRINNHKERKLTIDLNPGKDLSITNFRLNIGYNESGKDKVYIGFGARKRMKIDTNLSSTFHIQTDEIITPLNKSYSACKYQYHKSKRKNNELFEIESQSCGVAQYYSGNIFEKLNSDVSTFFYLNYGNGRSDLNDIKYGSIVIHDIGNLKIETIFPEPDKYNVHSISYSSEEKIKEVFANGIRFMASIN